jgi:hypothetical protein
MIPVSPFSGKGGRKQILCMGTQSRRGNYGVPQAIMIPPRESLDGVLLSAINPAGQDQEQPMPRLKPFSRGTRAISGPPGRHGIAPPVRIHIV